MKALRTLALVFVVIFLTLTFVTLTSHAQRSTPVTIVNEGTDPVPMQVVIGDSSEREPFQAYGSDNWTDCCIGKTMTFTVPADKRLIIDNFTATAQLFVRTQATVSIETTVNGVFARHHFHLELQLNAPQIRRDFLGIHKKVLLFADPGSDVTFRFYRNEIAPKEGGSAVYSLTGYLVPVP